MNILVDTSVWIDYFRHGNRSSNLDHFIDQNIICTNDLILAELVPYLKIKKLKKIISLLYAVNRIPLQVQWPKIIDFQTLCLQNGINKVGVPDLIILDNVLQNNLVLFSFDKHFRLLNELIKFELLLK